jgi:long-subunit fatty acid transport protein
VGIGASYTGIKNLLITADVALTKWSTWDVIVIKEENGYRYGELVEDWKDGVRMGIGLEYDLSLLKLRGSVYTEPRAAIPETMSPTIPDINRRNVGIIGVEVPVGPFRIHASYEKMFIDDLEVKNWNAAPDGKDYENLAGKYTMGVDNVMIGLDYKF